MLSQVGIETGSVTIWLGSTLLRMDDKFSDLSNFKFLVLLDFSHQNVQTGIVLDVGKGDFHVRREDDEQNSRALHVQLSLPCHPCLERELIARCVKPAPELHPHLLENTTFLEPLFFPVATRGFILR